MQVYESDELTRDKLETIRKANRCSVCGGWLNMFLDNNSDSPNAGKAFVACADWPSTKHQGILREASEYEKEGLGALNIESRRKIMEKQFGEEKTRALAKYEGVKSLTKNDAMVILESIWPEAPANEKLRAAMLCESYQLNPLRKHVFLIPFNKGKKNESWATVMGIGATRLLASRKGSFSYVDDTPRIMTEEEQIKRFGQSYHERLYVIVKVKDPKTGAEAPGYGWYMKEREKTVWDDQAKRMVPVKKDGKVVLEPNDPYGSDKGHSIFNAASYRAERQALDRLRPGEMPNNIEVMDEVIAERASKEGIEDDHTIEGEYKVMPDDAAGVEDAKEPEETEKPEQAKATEPEPEPAPEKPKSNIDPDWLKETLDITHWKEETAKSWIKANLKVETGGTLLEVCNKLNGVQLQQVVSKLQSLREAAGQ